MQITHEEARRLIHFRADDTLNPQQKSMLTTHLKVCFACRAYAEEIKEVESTLLPVMKRQWYHQPTPLSINAFTTKRGTKIPAGVILAIRTAAISFAFVVFAFAAWQFTSSGQQASLPLTVGVPPVPTPSIQSTGTKNSFDNCQMIPYEVQENDTLAALADQFSISKEEIMAINQMETETIYATMKLLIPACDSTPTVTVDPASITTNTPVFGLTTAPPDPSG